MVTAKPGKLHPWLAKAVRAGRITREQGEACMQWAREMAAEFDAGKLTIADVVGRVEARADEDAAPVTALLDEVDPNDPDPGRTLVLKAARHGLITPSHAESLDAWATELGKLRAEGKLTDAELDAAVDARLAADLAGRGRA
jgi:hypothetical protein